MKADIFDLNGKKKGSIELPPQFREELRADLIKKAVLAIQSHKRQPYGASHEAGKRHSTEVPKRRRKYRGCYGKGVSRVPRKVLSRQGTYFNWVGAEAPGTVGGRKAHPPKAEKDWYEKINAKERRKAIRSAIAATAIEAIVKKRGHKVTAVPTIIESTFEKVSKTKDVIDALSKIGLEAELERASQKKIRAGKGKMRGRKYKKKKGPLIVVSERCSLQRSALNIPGVDIINVKSLNAELLAPGCAPGRLTIWTDKAIERMAKENLFMDTAKK